MGGIETWRDALEFILMGAGSLQVTTAVMQYGYRIIDDLCSGLNYYLAQFGISNVRDIVGAGLSSVSDTTDVLERDTVLFPTLRHRQMHRLRKMLYLLSGWRTSGHKI
jgi:dihydroorotate oxidase B, catalytic subunit (EC 1.3.3.1)